MIHSVLHDTSVYLLLLFIIVVYLPLLYLFFSRVQSRAAKISASEEAGSGDAQAKNADLGSHTQSLFADLKNLPDSVLQVPAR
jgi:hypothetical protein